MDAVKSARELADIYYELSDDDLAKLLKDIQLEVFLRDNIKRTLCNVCHKEFQWKRKGIFDLRVCCSVECARKAYGIYTSLIEKADIERRDYIASKLGLVEPLYRVSAWQSPDVQLTAKEIVYGKT